MFYFLNTQTLVCKNPATDVSNWLILFHSYAGTNRIRFKGFAMLIASQEKSTPRNGGILSNNYRYYHKIGYHIATNTYEYIMFQPRAFKQQDQLAMIDFIKNHSLGSLVSLSSEGLMANHIPFLVIERNGEYILQGHVARANKLWQDYDNDTEALVMFDGPNAYISPNWYPSKKEDGKAVPTWNYVTVHVRGHMQTYQDKAWLLKHLQHLSQLHERTQKKPWKISDAPENYIDQMIKAIVGIEIKINTLQGQTKMSQNHSEVNRQGVIEGLKSQGRSDVAFWVENPNHVNT